MDKLPIIVVSLDNNTGELVAYDNQFIYCHKNGEPELYIWNDGNYACDCNRGLFHERAKGNEQHILCGAEQYSVDIYDAETLESIYSEIEAIG